MAAEQSAIQESSDSLLKCKKLMHQGDFSGAAGVARDILGREPGHPEARYLLAVCQRYLGETASAESTLRELLQAQPGYGRAHQELGHLLKASGKSVEAAGAYRRAVQCNNSLLASWQALAELADDAFAAQAREQARKLAALPRELLAVRNLIAEGKLLKAEQLCRDFLKKHKTHVEGMRLLADLAVRFDVLDDAEYLLESALKFEPDNRFTRYDYVNVLYRRQRYDRSLEEAERLLKIDPDNEAYKAVYANQCVAVGRYDEAIDIYGELLEKNPQADTLHLLNGHALKTIGRLDDAVSAYRSAYRARDDFGDAYWSLANLKTYRFSDAELASMRAIVDREGVADEDRVHLQFALGKALEDREDFAASFSHYEAGNTLKRQMLHYDADRMSEALQLQQSTCTAEFFAQRKDWGHTAPDPIFIVGLPRAGSTLLEQILASHSRVEGTFELPNIAALAHRLGGRRMRGEMPRYPMCLEDLDAGQCREFGEQFIRDTAIHRSGTPLFIDKMPNNFRHIGLIHLMLPNAKIIDARRHPMACCFSGFKQLFANGQEFTYGLREIGQYYRDYVELMNHWHSVLPGRIHAVQYEDVVDDLRAVVESLLDYCGLPFEEACVEFHRTERSIRTPSSEQVRQPIFKSGLEQWKKFEPWLDPLKASLGPALDHYRMSSRPGSSNNE